jgi:hypothetical protein
MAKKSKKKPVRRRRRRPAAEIPKAEVTLPPDVRAATLSSIADLWRTRHKNTERRIPT